MPHLFQVNVVSLLLGVALSTAMFNQILNTYKAGESMASLENMRMPWSLYTCSVKTQISFLVLPR